MVVSLCCHCCKLCSCLAVSSAIESMNAIISTFRVRDDDAAVIGREVVWREEKGVVVVAVVVGCEWVVVVGMDGVVVVVVVVEWCGESDRLSLCSSVLPCRDGGTVAVL